MPNPDIHILYAEDEELERISFVHILEKEGYVVHPAGSGRQAVELSTTGSFQIAILDLLLRDMTAFDIIPILKSHPPVPKILLLTADIRDEFQQKAQDLGVDAYLLKPVYPKDLLDVLRRELR